MNTIINAIAEKVTELVKQGDQLIASLEAFGWNDTRPERTKEGFYSDDDELREESLIPAQARIPPSFIHTYHQWYAAGLALVETNMPSRHKELVSAHDEAQHILARDYMDFSDQTRVATKLVVHQS